MSMRPHRFRYFHFDCLFGFFHNWYFVPMERSQGRWLQDGMQSDDCALFFSLNPVTKPRLLPVYLIFSCVRDSTETQMPLFP